MSWEHETIGAAFFLKTSSGASFRFVARELGWEGWDGSSVGPGPLGVLHYSEEFPEYIHSKVDMGGAIQTDYCVEQYFEERKLKVRIQFFHPKSPDVVFAEFIAYDPFDRAGKSGILDQRRTATWKEVDFISITGTAAKAIDTEKTTLTIAAVRKVAEMHFREISCESFNVQGYFIAKNITEFGNTVTWYRDCAIFHKDREVKYFTAYFHPVSTEDILGSKDDIKSGVTWKDMSYEESQTDPEL